MKEELIVEFSGTLEEDNLSGETTCQFSVTLPEHGEIEEIEVKLG